MKRIIVLCFLLLAGNVIAAPKIQHWETSNGARVYFFPATALPMMDLRVVFDAGAARDGEKHGLALLTNGLLSEGAGEWNTDQIAERFDGVGAAFSNSSHRDMSVVSLRSLTKKNLLDTALETFKTVLTQPTFPQDAFERERKRLLIGLERQKQSPDAISDKAFYQSLYGDHPYAHMASGEIETVKSINRDDLIEFYKQYFVAKNSIVAMVGDLSRAEAEKIAESIMSGLPAGQAVAKLPQVSVLAEPVNVEINFPSTQSHLLVGQPGISRTDPDYFPLYVGNHVLGGSGLVSTLSDEIREKRGLAYSSYSFFVPMRVQGPFLMGLQTKNESAQEALTVLKDVLRKFVEEGPTQEQLDAAKKNLVGGFALRLASNKKIVENIASIGFYQLPLNYLDQFIAKVEAVNLDQVKDAFKRRVNPDKLVTVIVGDTGHKQAQND